MNSPLPDNLRTALATQGFTLCAGATISSLPGNIWLSAAPFTSGSLLLIGHGGRRFWEALQTAATGGEHPVDTFSQHQTAELLAQYLPDTARTCLFPDDNCPVNLMALGRALGMHTPSPLGMGMHSEFGIWSAYRALWWLDTDIAPVTTTPTDHCANCSTLDCIKACPASALQYATMPDIQRCGRFRLQTASPCASQCLARYACPIASEHRYTPEQMAHHYDLERSRLRDYIQ